MKETRKYKLTGVSDLLGSSPGDKEVFKNFIVDKAKTPEERAAADLDTEFVLDQEEKKRTYFYRDPKTGELILRPYQIKGFLKEAINTLKADLKVLSAKSKVDEYVFVRGKTIKITRDGESLTQPDYLLERPLRAMTMQGPRVALASSEAVSAEEGWELEVEISLINNAGTAKSKPITWEVIEAALDYGALKGLLQWRNGGYGSFDWELVED